MGGVVVALIDEKLVVCLFVLLSYNNGRRELSRESRSKLDVENENLMEKKKSENASFRDGCLLLLPERQAVDITYST